MPAYLIFNKQPTLNLSTQEQKKLHKNCCLQSEHVMNTLICHHKPHGTNSKSVWI